MNLTSRISKIDAANYDKIDASKKKHFDQIKFLKNLAFQLNKLVSNTSISKTSKELAKKHLDNIVEALEAFKGGLNQTKSKNGHIIERVNDKIDKLYKEYWYKNRTHYKEIESLFKYGIDSNEAGFYNDFLEKRISYDESEISSFKHDSRKFYEFVKDNLNNIYKKIEDLEQYKELNIDPIKAQAEEIKEIHNNITEFSKESIISKYAERFNTLSGNANDDAKKWLTSVFVYSGVMVLLIFTKAFDYASIGIRKVYEMSFGIDNIKSFEKGEFNIILISQLTSKILIIALAVFILMFLVKQYLINKNLKVVYENKATALSSYYLFKESVGKDNKILNIIMAEVAHMIYSEVNAGLIKDKGDNKLKSGLGNLVSEVITESKDIIG